MSAPEAKSPTIAQLPRLSDQIKQEISKVSEDLKHVETVVKDEMPDKKALEEERNHERFKSAIQNFDEDRLRPVETNVKDQIPTSDQIAQEKAANVAAQIEKAGVNIENLKHVETVVKTGVAVEVNDKKE